MIEFGKRSLSALVLALFLSSSVLAQESHCEDGVGERRADTPSEEFELPRDGTVIHIRTDLQWAQCALGQNWSRDNCSGQAQSMTWSEAQAAIDELNRTAELAGHTDWRLPTRQELETIVEKCREAPTINTNIFPNTPWAGFWSSSLDTEDADEAWFVGFYYGLTLAYHRDSSYRVRPVRYP